jgi:hypothetical protein
LDYETYTVVISEGKQQACEFQFKISTTEPAIDIVVWSDDFFAFANNSTNGFEPLFEAILKFHQASAITQG